MPKRDILFNELNSTLRTTHINQDLAQTFSRIEQLYSHIKKAKILNTQENELLSKNLLTFLQDIHSDYFKRDHFYRSIIRMLCMSKNLSTSAVSNIYQLCKMDGNYDSLLLLASLESIN